MATTSSNFVYWVSVWLIITTQYHHVIGAANTCPCSTTSAVTDVAAQLLNSGNSSTKYCVIGAGFRSFRPFVAASLTYLPGSTASLSVHAVLGYIFAEAGLQYLLLIEGCPRLIMLTESDAPVPGTSLPQRVLIDSTNFANQPYLAQSNLLASSAIESVPSLLSPLGGQVKYDFSVLSSIEVMGVSESDFRNEFGNANVTTTYLPLNLIVVQKKGSPPLGNAVGSTTAGAEELVTQDFETLILNALNGLGAGTCPIILALAQELSLQMSMTIASGSIICSNGNILVRARVSTQPEQMVELSSPLFSGC